MSLRPHFTQSSLAMSTVPLPHSVLGCVTARLPCLIQGVYIMVYTLSTLISANPYGI